MGNIPQVLAAILLAIWEFPGTKVIVGLTLLNVVLAVAVAIRTGTFTFADLFAFLWQQLIPYVITYGGFKLAAQGTAFEWVADTTLVAIVTMLGARITANLARLGIGIPKSVLPYVTPRPQKVLVLGETREPMARGQ